jgi:D-sedoheptulose 7-phosphate isomerase
MILEEIRDHINVIDKLKDDIDKIRLIAEEIYKIIDRGNKVFFCGNGGSAGDSQHIAAEFTGRFKIERDGLPGLALTTDTSAITAISNDYGFENIFSRQLQALALEGDAVVGISTSGSSQNVINAFKYAKKSKIITIGFLGNSGGVLYDLSDYPIVVHSKDTARIQEGHILIGHLICSHIDQIINK